MRSFIFFLVKNTKHQERVFFSKPFELLKLQIKDEIAGDKTNRTKSLFFFLFFSECHTKMGKIEKLDLKSESSCKEFLNKIWIQISSRLILMDRIFVKHILLKL